MVDYSLWDCYRNVYNRCYILRLLFCTTIKLTLYWKVVNILDILYLLWQIKLYQSKQDLLFLDNDTNDYIKPSSLIIRIELQVFFLLTQWTTLIGWNSIWPILYCVPLLIEEVNWIVYLLKQLIFLPFCHKTNIHYFKQLCSQYTPYNNGHATEFN
jgi:hypothetical protein